MSNEIQNPKIKKTNGGASVNKAACVTFGNSPRTPDPGIGFAEDEV